MRRLNSLQGLRAVAFMGIFLGHCGIGSGGGMGVSVFLVLSGFLMIYNYYQKDDMKCGILYNIKFSANKIKKLYPLHLIMIIPMLALSSIGYIKSGEYIACISDIFPKLLADVSLIQAWIPIRSFYFAFNGVAWFLSVCAFLYFIFPYLLRKMKKDWSNKKSFIIIGVVILLQLAIALFANTQLCQKIVENTAWVLYICPLYRCGDFIIGCNLGYIFLAKNKKNNTKTSTATIFELLAIALMTLCYLAPKFVNVPEEIQFSLLYIPGSVALVYVFANGAGLISKLFSTKLFVEVGNISGYTFLIHQVVINLMESVKLSMMIVPVVSLVVTFLAAYAYRFVLTKVKRKGN